MSGPVFVDTNILVYVRDRTEEEKQSRAAEWMAALWDTHRGRLSMQVLQEYYVTVTRKLDPPRTLEEAREDVLSLRAWEPVLIDENILEDGWTVQDRYGFSWWDALIVAAAARSGSRWLLSEDFQDGQELFGLTIVSPFVHEPGSILGV
ncbi:MAG: PIN domain-containing protein [Longimicrobiales bacterium]|nr:PIN domain-containing protein [Longimicrobiales bacterium]